MNMVIDIGPELKDALKVFALFALMAVAMWVDR